MEPERARVGSSIRDPMGSFCDLDLLRPNPMNHVPTELEGGVSPSSVRTGMHDRAVPVAHRMDQSRPLGQEASPVALFDRLGEDEPRWEDTLASGALLSQPHPTPQKHHP